MGNEAATCNEAEPAGTDPLFPWRGPAHFVRPLWQICSEKAAFKIPLASLRLDLLGYNRPSGHFITLRFLLKHYLLINV
ncbi:MAG: hypothetical protein ABI967_00130 [bacterium]